MDIYIGKSGLVLGPYYPDEIQKRQDDDRLDGTELAWHEGLDEWVNVKEVLEDEAPVPEAEETSIETESAEEPEPLDGETLSQVNKIKKLIVLGHVDTAWQLIQSLNNPRIYEGLLEDCPVNEDGWSSMPEYLRGHAELFIKFLINLPESAWLKPGLRQLTKLDLTSSKLTDVSALVGLTQLTDLKLSGSDLDLRSLAGLNRLTYLYLSGCSDPAQVVRASKELTRLTVLHLNACQLTDKQLKHLAELKQLKELHLPHNKITEASVLANLTQLTKVNLSHNPITEVSALAGLAQLTELDLSSLPANHLKDVKGLEGLTNLKLLDLGDNGITDLTSLAVLTQLTELNLRDNNITNLMPLAELKELKKLDLEDNDITDLTPLAELKKLEVLDLERNNITDLTPLAELKKLKVLVLGVFRDLVGWGHDPDSNHITDLKPLTGLKNLRRLTVYRNFGLIQSEVDMLAAALPECSIGYYSLSEQRQEDAEFFSEMAERIREQDGPGG